MDLVVLLVIETRELRVELFIHLSPLFKGTTFRGIKAAISRKKRKSSAWPDEEYPESLAPQ